MIINETMARRHWPGQDPIGQKVRISWNDTRDDEVIGVVGDVRHQGLDAQPRAMTYWPHPRFPYPGTTIAIRIGRRRPVCDPGGHRCHPRPGPRPCRLGGADDGRRGGELASPQRRLTVQVIGMFALVALVLAAVGIYGVIAYMVTQRTQEIGIRMALGAQRGRVLRMVVGEALALTAAGAVVGTAASLLLTRLMKDLLFEVTPGDPLTLGVVTATLLVVALAASYLPGRRATRVDPVLALRAE